MQAGFLASILIGAVALAASPAYATGPAQLRVSKSPELGAYLTNRSGLALYTFSRDVPGSARGEAVINCTDTCLQIWTPLFTSGTPLAGPEVRTPLIGTTMLGDKGVVTYNGVPVYTYLVDRKEGDTEGHGMESFDGVWRLITPGGKSVTTR